MTLDKAESFYNSWRTMLPRTNEYSKGFIDNNKQSIFKLRKYGSTNSTIYK